MKPVKGLIRVSLKNKSRQETCNWLLGAKIEENATKYITEFIPTVFYSTLSVSFIQRLLVFNI
jgi:hypothetical protein